jgi:hypothetical protein
MSKQKKESFSAPEDDCSLQAVNSVQLMERGGSFVTEERARYYAKALARGMGIIFYAVRSREGLFLAVQIPSDDCEILAKATPPDSTQDAPLSRHEQARRAA